MQSLMIKTFPRSSSYCTLIFVLLLGAAIGAHGQGALPENHPKVKAVRQVFDRLVRAIGDGRTPPGLQVLPAAAGEMRIVWFSPQYSAVIIEERACDLLASLGPDSLEAMAWLLGHELAHYYKDHHWSGDFGNSLVDLQVGKDLKGLSTQRKKRVEIETEADFFGGLSGYVAGYNTFGIMPRALELLYNAYELDANLPGYPSLPERQEIARRAVGQLRLMVPIFEAGYRLLLLGQCEEAARCFEFIARTFPSREMLNNVGVAQALEALALFELEERPFAYPFELDTETRLRQTLKAKAGEIPYEENRIERRERLLTRAQEAFDRARQKDPDYAPAYINRACAADLLGEYEEAAYWAMQARKIAGKSSEALSRAGAWIAQGIAQAHLDPADRAPARASFEKAMADNAPLARLNLAVLADSTLNSVYSLDQSAKGPAGPQETIAGLSAQEYGFILDAPDVRTKLPPGTWGQPTLTIYSRQTSEWNGLLLNTGYSTIVLLSTGTGYTGESGRGIRRGQPLTQMQEAYGRAAPVIAGRQGLFHVYENSRIIFQTDADGQVLGWMVYRIE